MVVEEEIVLSMAFLGVVEVSAWMTLTGLSISSFFGALNFSMGKRATPIKTVQKADRRVAMATHFLIVFIGALALAVAAILNVAGAVGKTMVHQLN
jgi:uncharacterized membrane protein